MMCRLCGLFIAVGLFLAFTPRAHAINVQPYQTGLINADGQYVGTWAPGQQVIPLITAMPPPFPPPVQPLYGIPPLPPVPPFVATPSTIMTDGFKAVSIAPAYKGAVPDQPSLAVSLSPNPSPTCPRIATINQTANTTVITNPGGKHIFVCNAALINGATGQSVTISEGTGTTCGTGTTYWLGGSGGTAALAANGGFALIGINWTMQVAGDNVCVLVSGSTNVSGTMTYGVYP